MTNTKWHLSRTLTPTNKSRCLKMFSLPRRIALSPITSNVSTRFYSRWYTPDHEWVEVNGNDATVGITTFAQDALGDIVYVEIPKKGSTYKQGDTMAVIESVKAASDIYSPLSGTVTEGNSKLEKDPTLVNSDAEGAAWIAKLTIAKPEELKTLLTLDQYKKLTKK